MVLFAICAGVVSLSMVLFATAYLQVYSQFDGDSDALPADCAIVFGAAVYSNRLPGPAIVRRVSTAAELYRTDQIQTLILSGGRGVGNTKSEAAVMLREAVGQGVRTADILLEEESHSTWENILYAKNLTSNCKSVVGISDAYHLARIELVARRQGLKDFHTIPAGNRPHIEQEKKSVLREVFAYLYYALYLDKWITKSALEETFKDTTTHAPITLKKPINALASN